MVVEQVVYGRHQPVLLNEVIDGLAINSGGIYVDGTFGRGGHSRAILQQLGASGRLIALDRDPQAVEASMQLNDARLECVHSNFSGLQSVLAAKAVPVVDGVLLDLGVSSPQLDDASRGFSFRHDGPLDMRMDPTQGISAQDWLAHAPEQDIYKVLKDYGEERAAFQIAKAIVARRGDASRPALQTTRQLAELVANVIGRRQGSKGGRSALGKDPATRTFQAIRIFINQELEELTLGLTRAVAALRVGGRIAVISFHSLEDRIVKQFFSQASGKTKPSDLAARSRHHSTFAAVADAISDAQATTEAPTLKLLPKRMPSDAESSANPRARSAVLRVAIKLSEAG
jgi:16S rRNA (cytosine1402-N4)-methyltransferase